MTKKQARKLLEWCLQPDGRLHALEQYVSWELGDISCTLDAEFSAAELEALAWWMRHGTPVRTASASDATTQQRRVAPIIGPDMCDIPETVDAEKWAHEFAAAVAHNPGLASDVGRLTGWFTNALTAGWEGRNRLIDEE